ncbi:unnamed protein product [Protopolystoma xenopodis]|uniref:Uncharacterized protein n=1 Tax=Protopolystoma xenopodis TaxID=117903 RepID=A0A3S5ARD5_9PLAT|nr:unnamed protein product [Protopolystoma xenopodis]
MASHIPVTHIPWSNVHQEIAFSRGREFNEEMDIAVPNYLVDRRILKSIEFTNLAYIEAYVKKCPANVDRYFYLETFTSLSPMACNIVIANLLGFALLYRSNEAVKLLLTLGSKPLQPAYFIDWSIVAESGHKVIIHEAPTAILIASSLQRESRSVVIELMIIFRDSDLDFQTPVDIRRQQLERPNASSCNLIRCSDVWECLDKEIDKCSEEVQPKFKTFLKELKAVYRINKLDKLKEIN